MGLTLVRYGTKADTADENERKILAVFMELRQRQPSGLHLLGTETVKVESSFTWP
jgi:hypothetical protein